MTGELLLGVDVGTSSTKGVLARPDGLVVANAQRAHELDRPHPGWVEQDAEEVWWGDFCALCSELLPQADGPVAAVGVSGMGPCVLPADVEGRALRPAILYGIDARATAEIAELKGRYGVEAMLARGGSPLTTQAVGPKLLWLAHHEPEVWERTRKLFLVSSMVVHRLTGEYVLDHHSASQCDPLYDLNRNEWIGEWWDDIAPRVERPRLLWPHEQAGEVTREASELTGLAEGTPVVPGSIDTWAEAASVGVRHPGDMMLMYGTTMFAVEVYTEGRPDRRLWSTAGSAPGARNLAAGMATSGALAAWFHELTDRTPYETLFAEASEVAPGADGLVVLPYFSGERAPLFDPAARGVMCGLTLAHGRGHLFRALLEGTAQGLRHNLETMGEAGGGGRRITAVGGGTRSELWTQIVSDVTGRPQELPAQGVGASFGDCWWGGVATGLVDPGSDWTRIEGHVEPDQEAHAAYEPIYRVYRDLYPATKDMMHALADLQEDTALRP